MDKELISIIEDYVVSRIPESETRENVKQELIDAYETMQDFTEMDDGSFIMVTGNSEDEIKTWLSSEEANNIIEKGIPLDNHDKMIILTPDDGIKLSDYENYTSLQKAVNGNFEHCFSFDLPVDPVLCNGAVSIPCDLYCNEEFLIDSSEEFNKINAVASLIMSDERRFSEIRGNVALLPSTDDGGNRGFKYQEIIIEGNIEENLCECWSAEDTIMLFINKNAEMLDKIHKEFDNNKSDPKWGIEMI